MERYSIEEFEQLGEIGAYIVEGKKHSLPPWLKNKGKKGDDKDNGDDDDDKDKKGEKKPCKCGEKGCKCGKTKLQESLENMRLLAESGADPAGNYTDPNYENGTDDVDVFSAKNSEGKKVYFVVPNGYVDQDNPTIDDIITVDNVKEYPSLQAATAAIDKGIIDSIPDEEFSDPSAPPADDEDLGDERPFQFGDHEDDYFSHEDDNGIVDGEGEEDEDDDLIPSDQMPDRKHHDIPKLRFRELRNVPLECFGCEKQDSEGQMYLVRWNDGTKDWFCPKCYEEFKKEMDSGEYDGENEDGSPARFVGIVKRAIPLMA